MNRGSVPAGARSRREARERAVELGYQAVLREVGVEELLEGLPLPAPAFTVQLLRITEEHQAKADELIAERAKGWSLKRMPTIDLLVMRMAVVELLVLETPTGVVLSEAVDLASRYSTDESSRFVNGVLAAIAREVRPT